MTDLLDDFLQARAARGFVWFDADCATLAAEWLQLRTGADPLAPLRADGGMLAERHLLHTMRQVRAAGGLQAVAESLLGPAGPGLMAQRGHVVLVRSERLPGRVSGRAFGVCTGTHVAAPGADALVYLPLTMAEAAWRC